MNIQDTTPANEIRIDFDREFLSRYGTQTPSTESVQRVAYPSLQDLERLQRETRRLSHDIELIGSSQRVDRHEWRTIFFLFSILGALGTFLFIVNRVIPK